MILMAKLRTTQWLGTICWVFVAVLLGWLMIAGGRVYIFTRRAEVLINQIEPYQQTGSGSHHILFIGDSFAYGTGASSPETSLAGLFGQHFPDATVVNKGRNGTKSHDLAARLKHDIDRHYDLIVVIVGSNDIIHPEVQLPSTRRYYADIYAKAANSADKVVAITAGDFRDVTFFWSPLNHYFGARSDYINQLAEQEANKHNNITYIDAADDNTMLGALESEDHLHPSDLGNHYWFQKILHDTSDLALSP